MPDYVSPGAAFSDTLVNFMARRDAKQRQSMIDQLAAKKEAALEEDRQIAHSEKKLEMAVKLRTEDEKDYLNFRKDMVLGDIMGPDRMAQAKRLGYNEDLVEKTPQPVPGTQPMAGAPPVVPQEPPPGVAAPQPVSFRGTGAERATAQADQKKQAFVQSLPPGQAKLAFGAELAGLKTPASEFKEPNAAPANVPVMTREAALAKGSIPKDARIIEPLQPKSTDAADMRASAHRDAVYQSSRAAVDKLEQSYDDQLKGLNNLGVTLTQMNNPKADALIAIELLKSTVAGGGVRVNNPEITQVLSGSRTKWDDLSLKLNAWGGDKDQPLVLTADEKTAIRSLVKALRTGVRKQLTKFHQTRDTMDDSDDPKAIQRAVTKLHKDLGGDDTGEDAPAADAPKRHRYDMNGKPLAE